MTFNANPNDTAKDSLLSTRQCRYYYYALLINIHAQAYLGFRVIEKKQPECHCARALKSLWTPRTDSRILRTSRLSHVKMCLSLLCCCVPEASRSTQYKLYTMLWWLTLIQQGPYWCFAVRLHVHGRWGPTPHTSTKYLYDAPIQNW